MRKPSEGADLDSLELAQVLIDSVERALAKGIKHYDFPANY